MSSFSNPDFVRNSFVASMMVMHWNDSQSLVVAYYCGGEFFKGHVALTDSSHSIYHAIVDMKTFAAVCGM